jgi:cation:H+ antiporter
VLTDVVLVIGGVALLLGGAWQLVRSAVALSLMWGVSRVVVGATVVAFGTSAPEFVVTLVAAVRGQPDIALGNVIGSNVANVALALGIAASIRPLRVDLRMLRWELPVLGAATLALLLFAANGVVGHAEGACMVAGLIAFVVLSPRLFPELAAAAESDVRPAAPPARNSGLVAREVALAIAGLAALAIGANFAVAGGADLATRAGMSQLAIGVAIVAAGTSLPEFATSIVAAARGEHEIAVANVVGSNIFNLLGVIGMTALIAGLPVRHELYHFALPSLAASSFVVYALAWPRARVGRAEGALLIGAYALFIMATLRWT